MLSASCQPSLAACDATGVRRKQGSFHAAWSTLWLAISKSGSAAIERTTSGYDWVHKPVRKIVAGVWVARSSSTIEGSYQVLALPVRSAAYTARVMSASNVRAIRGRSLGPCVISDPVGGSPPGNSVGSGTDPVGSTAGGAPTALSGAVG